CKAIRYRLQWPQARGEARVPARQCSCSFCQRIDGVWTSHPEARLEIYESTRRPATRYRFGTETADFLFCSECGITPLVICQLDGRDHAVVNVNTFDPAEEPGFEFEASTSDFDGESVDERLARRQARWIGNVEWRHG
ncbi:MAG: GFA family protein, partial [Xanthomonadales bacterium]|nr:GFA family protein [Xanthomonadales bacterium]